MIVLDTNVVSELMRPQPVEAVVEGVDHQHGSEVYLTAITVAELLYGVARLPDGQRNVDDFTDTGIVIFNPWVRD